ncbi:oligosaccharide flippase family protein [Leptolyngbya sp. NK1-12]|uniref:Oligosaccharide flippase family protein n=1 Tax=Leptolyngbya sp. NK1-12 TaxID=2547451 RepID=A0AA97AES1_9CYAN|nr:oligosaccharide flippase family protein [Leptolyngbya sp. NK1-12]
MASSTENSSVKKLAIRGALWTIVGFGAGNIVRFISNLILTRLLAPELFGLMALIYAFITGLHMFSDVGIGVSIIQNKRGDEREFLNTAWTIQVVRGVLIWVGCFFLAHFVAFVYKDPRFLWLLPVVGLNTVITGFTFTAIFSLNRHLSIKEVALFELSGQIVGIVVMITWAFFHRSVWALVAGGIASSVYQVWMSYRLSKGKPNRFAWDKSAARELISFGAWIFLTTAITFLGEQADRLILGKVLIQDLGETAGLTLLGVYGIALTFAELPRAVTNALNGKVMMPAFSKIIDQPRSEVRTKVGRKRKYILVLMALAVALMVCMGDVIIKTLYDSRYSQAAWMLPILVLGLWPRLMCNTNEALLFAIGRPQYTAGANFTRFVCTSVGIYVGYNLFGMPGAVIGVALNDLFYHLVINWGLWREGLGNVKQDILASGILFAVLAVLLSIRQALGFGLPIDTMF